MRSNKKVDSVVANGEEITLMELSPHHLINAFKYAFCLLLMIMALPLGNEFTKLLSPYYVLSTGQHHSIIITMILIPMFSGSISWLRLHKEITVITNQRIIEKRGIISQEDPVPLYKVKDFSLPAQLTHSIFGVGDIVVDTLEERQPTIRIRGVRQRNEVQQQLDQIVERQKLIHKGYFYHE